MVTHGDYIDCGEHWVIYKIAESVCCILETNIKLYVKYTSTKKMFKKRIEAEVQRIEMLVGM